MQIFVVLWYILQWFCTQQNSPLPAVYTYSAIMSYTVRRTTRACFNHMRQWNLLSRYSRRSSSGVWKFHQLLDFSNEAGLDTRLMFSVGCRSLTRSCLKIHKYPFFLSRSFFGNEARPGLPKPPSISELATEQDTEEARTWATQFVNVRVPKEAVDFSFSRSSGPGGQVRGCIQPFRGLAADCNEFHRTSIKWTQRPHYDVLQMRRGFLVGLCLMY